MAEIRGKVQASVPGLEIETAQLMEDLIGDLTAVPQPIEVKLFSDDPAVLADSAAKVQAAMGKVEGIGEVASGLRVAGDGIIIKVDRSAAAQAGLDPDMVARQIENQLGGSLATQILAGEQLVDIRVRLPQALRKNTAAIGQMSLRSADGHLVSLNSVASIGIAAGQRQITREDLAPFIPVTARLEGRDLGSAVQAVKAAVSGLKLPASVRVDYGGLYAQQQQSFADLTTVFVAALLLSALLLTALFERWAFTVAVLATVMLSTAAVFIGLWLTGTELDISALMGLTMVVGMITELAIFYLAELNPDDPIGASELVQAGKARLRPIIMSALIAILTLAPLALGMGRGSGLQRPLATAIIFGLVIGAPLVLTALPMLALVTSRKKQIPSG